MMAASVGRTHTPEELAEAQRIIRATEPLRQKMRIEAENTDLRWEKEIEMLERRVATATEQVSLGGGDSIAIRSRLSVQEGRDFQKLVAIWQNKDKSHTPEEATEAGLDILEMVTANPILTKDWFRTNPSKYSALDTIPVFVGFFERLMTGGGKVTEAESFRKKQEGAELRGSPVPSGHS